MNRITKGLLLLAGLAIPSVLAAIFVFGCCVLPFHHQLHGAMTLCHVASEVLTGHHDGDEHGAEHPAAPPPSRERLSLSSPSGMTPASAHLFAPRNNVTLSLQQARADLRSLVSLGAVRCENDVGLLLLLTTFRI